MNFDCTIKGLKTQIQGLEKELETRQKCGKMAGNSSKLFKNKGFKTGNSL